MEHMFKAYLKLRSEIDNLANKLFSEHQTHINCRKGCAACCIDYSIFPLEFQSIKNQLTHAGFVFPEYRDDTEACLFLKDGACSIYEHRPIICRTHGLPLLYLNPDSEEWELSACDLNFTDFDDFDEQNTFPQDKYNSRLFLLNEQFIASFGSGKYGKLDLLPIRDIKID